MAGRGKQVREESSGDDEVCVVCFRSVEIYSIGECDHPVCYECSTRMRVLCARNECPICRKDMSKVSQYVQSIMVYIVWWCMFGMPGVLAVLHNGRVARPVLVNGGLEDLQCCGCCICKNDLTDIRLLCCYCVCQNCVLHCGTEMIIYLDAYNQGRVTAP